MKELEGVPPELASLVDAERAAPASLVAERAHILDRLTAAHGVSAGTAASASTGTAASASAGTAASAASTATALSLVGKVLLLGLAAAGTFGAGFYVGNDRTTAQAPSDRVIASDAPLSTETTSDDQATPPAQDHTTAPDPAPAAFVCPPPPAPASSPAPACACPSQPAAPAAPAAPAPAEPPPSLGEAALLREAWAATERGDPFAALRALEQHAAEFAEGSLVEERDALWVRVLVDAVEYGEARERAREFQEKYPQSIHRAAVDRALAEIP